MATRFKLSFNTVYKCHSCGAASYRPVIERDAAGALRPTGQYRCTGCCEIFSNVKSWWSPRSEPTRQFRQNFA